MQHGPTLEGGSASFHVIPPNRTRTHQDSWRRDRRLGASADGKFDMAEEPVLLTRAGLERLETELHRLKTVRRAEGAAAIREAQELGPDQLDAQYEDAKNQQAFLEGRIGEIERQLENVSIIDERAAAKSKLVQVGSTVTVKNAAGKSQKYQVVGPAEADPTQGRISYKSPVGRAVIGKKKGDKVTIKAPAGEVELTITTIA